MGRRSSSIPTRRLTSGDTDTQVDIYQREPGRDRASHVRGGQHPRASRSCRPTRAACSSNRTHGPSLAYPSCNPPAQESSVLTVGTPDANGAAPNSQSSVRYLAYPGAPGPPDDSVMQIIAAVNDVRCRTVNAACGGGANSDYTGKILISASIRLSDKLNGSPAVESATAQDFRLEVPVQCGATAGTEGGNCTVTTTVNSLFPGSILDGKRAIWADRRPQGRGRRPERHRLRQRLPGDVRRRRRGRLHAARRVRPVAVRSGTFPATPEPGCLTC